MDASPSTASPPRALSHWGWGWADRWPDADARAQFAALLSAMRGLPVDPREPVPLSEARIRPSRLTGMAFPIAGMSTDDEARARATWGRGFVDLLRGFEGDFSAAPDAVARPTSTDEVAAVLAWCEAQGVVVVPRGGGTSVVGGVTLRPEDAPGPVVVLDLTAMHALREVDAHARLAWFDGGALGPQVQQALAPHGLSLRHFPQSWEHSTVGGWIATRAGGHYATGRTHIEDLVAGLEVVTPRGLWRSPVLPASGAGPAPDRWMAGSEGILGVITGACLRVQARPQFRSRASMAFDRFTDAVDAVRTVAQSLLWPTNCRLLSPEEATLNQVGDGRAVVLLAFEDATPTASRLEAAMALCAAHGGECPSGPRHEEGERADSGNDAGATWKNAFFDGPYLQSLLLSFGLVVDTFETACTWTAFWPLHQALQDATAPLFAAMGGGSLSVRFTHVYPDGPAPYYTFVAASGHGRQEVEWRRIKEAVSDVLLAHGATITHHHAVGRLHRPWYERERPALFGQALQAVARELDPAGILNPGVLLAPR